MKGRYLLSAFLLAGAFLAVWAFWWEPASLRVRHYRLELPGLPEDFPPLKVVVISDLHAGAPYIGPAKIADIVRRANAEQPDLILLPGDFVADGMGATPLAHETIAELLSGLDAPLGVFAVLGNHDHWDDAAKIRGALESSGIALLENASVALTHEGHAFWLAGISDFYTAPHDAAAAYAPAADDDAPLLAFTHTPDIFPELPEKAALVIAGHMHGGQVHLPLIGSPLVPSKYRQRYLRGHIEEAGRHYFVSPGIGTSVLPVRFGAPPEISLLQLVPAGR